MGGRFELSTVELAEREPEQCKTAVFEPGHHHQRGFFAGPVGKVDFLTEFGNVIKPRQPGFSQRLE
jgi:hypothetical protein